MHIAPRADANMWKRAIEISSIRYGSFILNIKRVFALANIPVGAGFACPNAPVNRADDVFQAGIPRPYGKINRVYCIDS
jgi:hypothetical protein